MARQLRFDLGPCLFFGDNLDVLPAYIADESVDLIYLDPPWNSKRSYNAIFKHQDGTPAAAQIKAFDDMWKWSWESETIYRDVVEGGGAASKTLQGLRQILDTSDMLAYLVMMTPRLIELKRVLKETGTLYLHCDSAASHYLKLLLDAIFGVNQFLNEIIWHYQTSGGAPQKTLIRDHDTIFRYSKGPAKNVTWEAPREPWPESTLKKWQKDERGRIYHIHNDTGKRYYIDPRGKLMDDVWDITLAARSKERLGYPTQKPFALLERIITASTNPGDTVLDPFCGCGTAIDAAQKLGRRWIGIDITKVAIEVIQKRLNTFYPNLDYSVRGVPTTMEEVEFLADRDKFAFQQWVCDRLGIDADIRKGADKGIDGEIVKYTVGKDVWRAVVSVKGGGVNVTQIRDLRGTMEREKADAGIFVTRKPPTRPMRDEAISAGFGEGNVPKIQILTAEDLLAGKSPVVPATDAIPIKPIEPVAKSETGVVPTHRRRKAG